MTTEERAEDYLEHPPKYPGSDSAIPIIEDLLRLYRLEKNRVRPVIPSKRAFAVTMEDIDNIIDAFCADSPLRLVAIGDLDAAAEYENKIMAALKISTV